MRTITFATLVMTLATIASGCSGRPSPTAPAAAASAAIAGAEQTSSGGGGGAREELTGPAIGGVVPQGQATADMSRFSSGGSTTLTVQIKNVNLPDGVVLQVTLDFSPVGTITVSRGQGTLVTSLGHFAVSRDQVRVNNAGKTILSGSFFS